jgi:hypothetical protein
MILRRETQRPSWVKEWQMPQGLVLPRELCELLREVRVAPEEEQETSYLAAEARRRSFWRRGGMGSEEL